MTGNEIKRIIKSHGYELKDVAELMNMTPQRLNSLLKPDDLKLSILKLVARSINISVYELIGIEEPNKMSEDSDNYKDRYIGALEELNALRKENKELERKLNSLQGNEQSDTNPLATIEDAKSASA